MQQWQKEGERAMGTAQLLPRPWRSQPGCRDSSPSCPHPTPSHYAMLGVSVPSGDGKLVAVPGNGACPPGKAQLQHQRPRSPFPGHCPRPRCRTRGPSCPHPPPSCSLPGRSDDKFPAVALQTVINNALLFGAGSFH